MSFGAIPGMEEALGRCGPCCASDVVVLGAWAPRMKFQWLGSPPIYMPLDGHFITRPTRSLGDLRITMVINHLLNGMILQVTTVSDPEVAPGRVSAKELPKKSNEVSG